MGRCVSGSGGTGETDSAGVSTKTLDTTTWQQQQMQPFPQLE
jgi:hypothetical protein